VKDVIVCYECQAVHRGYPANPLLKPFDLVIHDRVVGKPVEMDTPRDLDTRPEIGRNSSGKFQIELI